MSRLLMAFALVTSLAGAARAQLPLGPGESCTVQVLNQTVHVATDGTWSLDQVPTSGGLVRARLYCTDGVNVRRGQSDLFPIVAGAMNAISAIPFEAPEATPSRLTVTAPVTRLESAGATAQLVVTGFYDAGFERDLTGAAHGTSYASTRPDVASVDADGLVTAHASGTVLITAWNEAIPATVKLTIVTAGDADADGLPDDWEAAHGLDANDPLDAGLDPDADGLTHRQEYAAGTDPWRADTDGDRILDGEEVAGGVDGFVTDPTRRDSDGDRVPDNVEILLGTDPNDPLSVDLELAVTQLVVRPGSVQLLYNPVFGEASAQVTLTAVLIDGSAVDLTDHDATVWTSNRLDVAGFGVVPGQVFAGQAGIATVTAEAAGKAAVAYVTVSQLTPRALGSQVFSGYPNDIVLRDPWVFAAGGHWGLRTLDISYVYAPKWRGALATPGNANGLALAGDVAWVAVGDAGILAASVADPAAPAALGLLDTPGTAWNVAVHPTRAGIVAVADGPGGLRFVAGGDPAAPQELSSVALTGTTKALAFDGALLAVARGRDGVSLVDAGDPANPQLLGSMALDGRDARELAWSEGGVLVVATLLDGLTTLDASDPAAPRVLAHAGVGQLMLNDVVVRDAVAIGADIFRVNDVPFVQLGVPTSPTLSAVMPFADGYNGVSVDADDRLVVMAGTRDGSSDAAQGLVENGVSAPSGGRIHVGRWNARLEADGLAPTVVIARPPSLATVAQGAALDVVLTVLHDDAVEHVAIELDGSVVAELTRPPWETTLAAPVTPGLHAVRAVARDFAGEEGASTPVAFIVVELLPTTVVGFVVDADGAPIGGATIEVRGRTTAADAEGAFAIADVPGSLPVFVAASATRDGQGLSGHFGPFAPVPGGETDAGALVLSPDADAVCDADGRPCDDGDGNACTAGRCLAGVCIAVSWATDGSACGDPDACVLGTCVAGTCETRAAREGAACADATPADPCGGGVCDASGACVQVVDPTCTLCSADGDCTPSGPCVIAGCSAAGRCVEAQRPGTSGPETERCAGELAGYGFYHVLAKDAAGGALMAGVADPWLRVYALAADGGYDDGAFSQFVAHRDETLGGVWGGRVGAALSGQRALVSYVALVEDGGAALPAIRTRTALRGDGAWSEAAPLWAPSGPSAWDCAGTATPGGWEVPFGASLYGLADGTLAALWYAGPVAPAGGCTYTGDPAEVGIYLARFAADGSVTSAPAKVAIPEPALPPMEPCGFRAVAEPDGTLELIWTHRCDAGDLDATADGLVLTGVIAPGAAALTGVAALFPTPGGAAVAGSPDGRRLTPDAADLAVFGDGRRLAVIGPLQGATDARLEGWIWEPATAGVAGGAAVLLRATCNGCEPQVTALGGALEAAAMLPGGPRAAGTADGRALVLWNETALPTGGTETPEARAALVASDGSVALVEGALGPGPAIAALDWGEGFAAAFVGGANARDPDDPGEVAVRFLRLCEAAADCDRGDPCEVLTCGAAGVCEDRPEDNACACTDDRDCAGLEPNACHHGVACVDGACVATGHDGDAACFPLAAGTVCRDAVCDPFRRDCELVVATSGSCQPDGNTCSQGSCVAGSCVASPEPYWKWAACDDAGDACTRAGRCEFGTCAFDASDVVACDPVHDGGICRPASCDPVTGGCVPDPQAAVPANACGGCATLAGTPGAACATGDGGGGCALGAWACDGGDAVSCVGADACERAWRFTTLRWLTPESVDPFDLAIERNFMNSVTQTRISNGWKSSLFVLRPDGGWLGRLEHATRVRFDPTSDEPARFDVELRQTGSCGANGDVSAPCLHATGPAAYLAMVRRYRYTIASFYEVWFTLEDAVFAAPLEGDTGVAHLRGFLRRAGGDATATPPFTRGLISQDKPSDAMDPAALTTYEGHAGWWMTFELPFVRAPYAPICTADADCADASGCLLGACVIGSCVYERQPDSTECAYGDACQRGYCNVSHACTFGGTEPDCCVADESCGDGVACSRDHCYEDACLHAPLIPCAACSQAPGAGVWSAEAGCDDGDVCTQDVCYANLDASGVAGEGLPHACGHLNADLDEDGVFNCSDGDMDGDGAPNDLDCGPLAPEDHPGAAELCDGRDNDCDGWADDGAPCGRSCAWMTTCMRQCSYHAAQVTCRAVCTSQGAVQDGLAAEELYVCAESSCAMHTDGSVAWWRCVDEACANERQACMSCGQDADCDDALGCTDQVCAEGQCVYAERESLVWDFEDAATGGGGDPGFTLDPPVTDDELGWRFQSGSGQWYGKLSFTSPNGLRDLDGVIAAGAATSPPIAVPPAARLRFQLQYQGEWYAFDRWDKDLFAVEVETAAGDRYPVATKSKCLADLSVQAAFYPFDVDLSAFGGRTVRLRFVYDDVDATFNRAPAIRVEDVRIAPDCGPRRCEVPADCDDGHAFTVEACGAGGVCQWTLEAPAPCTRGVADDARTGGCDDGLACTVDVCLDGICQAITADPGCCAETGFAGCVPDCSGGRECGFDGCYAECMPGCQGRTWCLDGTCKPDSICLEIETIGCCTATGAMSCGGDGFGNYEPQVNACGGSQGCGWYDDGSPGFECTLNPQPHPQGTAVQYCADLYCGDGVADTALGEGCDHGPDNCATAGCAGEERQVFTYTGATQEWVVPAGVTQLTAKVWGGGGGGFSATFGSRHGGPGGYALAAVPVTPGETLTILVGGGGPSGSGSAFPNGGAPSVASASFSAGGGGGRSALQRGAFELVVAGGGGGSGQYGQGGAGGGLAGAGGEYHEPNNVPGDLSLCAGGGGTQEAGGAAGGCQEGAYTADPGAHDQGGDAHDLGVGGEYAGGGGDGYYGGGAGAWHAGGGGGSGHLDGGVTGSLAEPPPLGERCPLSQGDPDFPVTFYGCGGYATGQAGGVILRFTRPGTLCDGGAPCLRCDLGCRKVIVPGP